MTARSSARRTRTTQMSSKWYVDGPRRIFLACTVRLPMVGRRGGAARRCCCGFGRFRRLLTN